jgi:TPR repeat protein
LLLTNRARGFIVAALAAAAALLLASAAEAAGRRVALVIGNAAYAWLPQLANSVNDSAKVRDTLREAGFDTFYGADLTRIDLEALIQRFFRAADNADITIVYYSGHGVQVGGDNFIVPVDTKLATPYDIEQQTVKVADIFNYVSLHSRAQLIFLDACRNNPFKIDRFWIGDTLKVADSRQGLARTDYGVGSLIAFSTEPGAVAYDGLGQLSPYTSALVRHITAPNEEIRRALTLVRREVIAATDGRQVPWENSALVDDVYLMQAPPAPSVPAMVRVSVPVGESPSILKLPRPQRASDDGFVVRIEQLPDQGKLLLDGKLLDSTRALAPEDLNHLSFDARGLAQGAIELVTYNVSDKWQQTARGVVAITVEAAPAATAASEAQDNARSSALASARAWFRTLDRLERSTPIGVGPVLLALDGPPPFAADNAQAILVAKTPDAGVLKLGDRAVTRGQQIALADLPKLAYQPAVGGEGLKDKIALELAGIPDSRISVAVAPALDGCDREAASPLDLQGVGAGKLPNEINATKAIAACERASRDYPGVPRFSYQLGRAQLAAGLNAEARASIATAAQAKHTRAIWELGNLEAFGAFGAADLEKANTYYRQCSDAGDAYCFLAYGRNLFYGRGITADPKHGIDLMLRAAELGHTYAMNELGYVFLYGRGAHVDKERGLRFYEAGAEREDIYSLNNLGLVYLRGTGRPADATKALSYFVRAANGGHPYAPTNLGRMARDGVGGPKDLVAAAKWLELAAERGDYWGALDRGRLATDGAVAARYFALAVSLNREGDNFDADKQAALALAKITPADKSRALEQLTAELGEDSIVPTGTTDDRLIQSQGRAWQKRNPRFDLF